MGPKDVCWERFGGARTAGTAALTVGAVSHVRNVLDAMLRCGMAHGDVREDNAVWDAVEGRAYVVDLSHATTEGDAEPAEFARLCHEDLSCEERLIPDARCVGGVADLRRRCRRRSSSSAAAAASAASPGRLLR